MKTRRIFLPVVGWLLIFSVNAVSQDVASLTGVVRDARTGLPIETANVTVGDTRGAVSDAEGKFSLAGLATGQVTITASFVGYSKTEMQYNLVEGGNSVELILVPEFTELSSVTVVGETEEQAEARRIINSVMPVTVLTASQIENRASNLNELLARQTGVQIRRTGGLGSAARISVRGLEGKRVQIFIDGNPLNTPDGSLGINDLPLQIIERIEIYKGTVPAWLGGDGLGSAVNVVIRHRDISYIDATASYQSFNTINTGLIVKETFKDAGIEAGLGVFTNSSDNDYVMELPNQPGTEVKRDHDKFRSLLMGGALRFHKLWLDEVEIEGAYIKSEKELQGIERNIQHVESIGKTGVIALALRKAGLFNNKLSLRYHGTLADFKVNFIDTASYNYDWAGNRSPSIFGRGEIGNGPNLAFSQQEEFRQQVNLNYILNNTFTLNLNNTVRYGSFQPRDDVGNEFAGKNLYNYPATLINSTTGLTLETRGGEKLLFSTALKHYYNQAQGYNTNIYLQESPKEVANITNTFGYNAGLRYNFTPELLVKVSHERAVRLPDNAELFGDGALITPAIYLLPETAMNYSMGLIYDRVTTDYRRLQAETNVFCMNVENLIQLRGNGLAIGYGNFGKALIYGIDAEVKYEFTQELFASFNITWQRPTDANRYSPGTEGVPNPTFKLTLPNTPLFFGNWSVEYSKEDIITSGSRTKIIYDGSYVGKYNYGFTLSRYNGFAIPSFLTHTISIEQSFVNNRYTVTAEVNNLTDEIVLNNFNQPLPGRTFRIKVRYLLLGNKTVRNP